jgi:surface antigen
VSQTPKTSIGALGGAAVGGLIVGVAGAGGAGIAAGLIGGGLLVGPVGNLLDERDHLLAAQATHQALETAPSGKSVSWNSPDNGHAGTVTPAHTYQAPGGGYCREYETTITVDGRQERGHGAACQQPDGCWQIAK